MFTHLSGPDVVPVLHALLLDRLALELTDNWSAYTTTPTPRVEELPEPAELLLQLAVHPTVTKDSKKIHSTTKVLLT
jgi:hypothetical protein